MELGFFKMFIWFLPQKSLKRSYIRATVRNGQLEINGRRHEAVPNLLQKVERCKNEIRKICIDLLDNLQQSQYCKFSNSNELLQFINCTLRNLKILVRKEAGSVVYVRMQICALMKKLRVFRDFVKSTGKGLCFSIHVEEWAKKVACVSMLYWEEEEDDQMEEAMVDRMKDILSNLLEMAESCTPEVVGMYVRALKVSEISKSNDFQIDEVVSSFVDFLLPFGFMKILREELVFLITFLMNPYPIERKMDGIFWDIVVINAEAVAREVPSLVCALTSTETDQETEERINIIGDFQEKIVKVKSEVRKLLHFKIRSYFPAIDALGFIDSLLEKLGNLKEKSILLPNFPPLFVRDKLVTLHKELLSVRPRLKYIHAMQNESVELKGLWIQISDAACLAERVIDSCKFFYTPIWYSLLFLSDVIEEIKSIKRQMKKIMNIQVHPDLLLSDKANSCSIHLGQACNNSRLEGVVIGLEDEAETIVNRLTRGSMKLDIVSIVGMPGQGKTTLARKVYHNPSIQRHFHKHAWCFVTQVYEPKTLLLDILREVTSKLDDEVHNMSKEDLAQKLYKCLKGQRYLMIMDDIWDAATWNAVKESFPDNENGSRILFTSRNKFICDPYLLRSLSDTEVMKLLEQRIFPKDGWPSSFSDDMKKVLKICNGLPLAIVVVAGMLEKVSNDFVKWTQIVQNLNPKLASEGCMDILELSYKNLPDFLKPCFLYLGEATRQNKVFKVCKLIQLWIAEGFVPKFGTKCQEELGMEYLENLISRSLVTVLKRDFSSGEIKECCVHDLLLGFCSIKAEEERFMHFSEPFSCNHYRLCIFGEEIFPSVGIGPKLRSLLNPLGNSQLPFSYDSTYSSFFRLRFLRVLDLGTVVAFGFHFPEAILLLICLRFLSIKCDTEVVPLTIGNLRNLETFHVIRSMRKKVILQLPHTIWNMKSLRNINVGRGSITLLDDNASNVCPQLGNLHCFSSLCLSNVEDAEQILRGFPSVRKLKLEISKSWDCKGNCDRFPVLHSLIKLESLNLKYSEYVAHSCALNFPTTLKKLTLSMFYGSWSEISTIGKLPNLEVFKLGFTSLGATWVVEDEEFLNLKYLKLTGLAISRWEVSTSSFPCLERLLVKNCNFLLEFPSIFEDVSTLKTIQVFQCHKSLSTSAEIIRNEQWDMGNDDLEVLISNDILDVHPGGYEGVRGDRPHRASKNWGASNFIMDWSILSEKLAEIVDEAYDGRPSAFLRAVLENLAERMGVALHVPNDHIENALDLLGFDEKKDIDSKKRYVQSAGTAITKKESARRMNLMLKHNCQPRQAVMSRHHKQELKREI